MSVRARDTSYPHTLEGGKVLEGKCEPFLIFIDLMTGERSNGQRLVRWRVNFYLFARVSLSYMYYRYHFES